MKKILIVITALVICFTVSGILISIYRSQIKLPINSPIDQEEIASLEHYSIESLSESNTELTEFEIGELIEEQDEFNSYKFYFYDKYSDKPLKVSGQVNIPKSSTSSGIMIMLRGYVDREIYETGVGTKRSAGEFAKNGYVTLAPDFLGYGDSDMPGNKLGLEERFQTYTTTLTLINSLSNLEKEIQKINSGFLLDDSSYGIWAHSNGGQIALTVLSITERNIPTILWAPVTKSFPYNILYFTDEYEDQGKVLRKIVSDFETNHDVEDFSFTNYLNRVKSSIQIHQGVLDEAVPVRWSDQFVLTLDDNEIENEYYKYPGENHNFQLGSFETAIGRSIEFINSNLDSKN